MYLLRKHEYLLVQKYRPYINFPFIFSFFRVSFQQRATANAFWWPVKVWFTKSGTALYLNRSFDSMMITLRQKVCFFGFWSAVVVRRNCSKCAKTYLNKLRRRIKANK